ncbi:MAG: selenoneine biosynthesis selenosugar synthase SenB [Gammaproteobacteria bacterium]|nr:selenoneine biosynthesis selenosugar synthase SenB [Gammaproteobacteria bacterium]
MHIQLISPAKFDSRNGNRTTAVRWRNILQSLGHRVTVSQKYLGQDADIMLALHAWRSADSIQLFAKKFPTRPLLVALTGTDVYRFLYSHAQQTLTSIQHADRLIGLHANIASSIPQEFNEKVRVIFQSTETKLTRRTNKQKDFQVCIAGHLRAEKDSLRPAYAVRSLPSYSAIKISHYGKAHSKNWEDKARLEMAKNRRYHWYGEISQSLLQKKFAQSDLLVLPSLMEGGANIISEAIIAQLPVVTSNIVGSIGLLGENYSGYFNVGNSDSLKQMLLRCESNNKFYQSLVHQCNSRRLLFTPSREKSSWKKLIAEL